MAKEKLPADLQDWVDARKRHRLSHAHVQMAQQLGMNPRKLGKIDNHRQEPWKAPLPLFIEHLYLKKFGRERPEVVMPLEERASLQKAKQKSKKAAQKARKAARTEERTAHEAVPPLGENQ